MMHIIVSAVVVVAVIDEPYQILRTNYQFYHLLKPTCCLDRYTPYECLIRRKRCVFFSPLFS